MNRAVTESLGTVAIGLLQLVGLLASLAAGAAVVAVVFWHEAGLEWVDTYFYWPVFYASLVAIALALLCLPVSLIPAARPIAGTIIFLSSYVMGYLLCVCMLQ